MAEAAVAGPATGTWRAVSVPPFPSTLLLAQDPGVGDPLATGPRGQALNEDGSGMVVLGDPWVSLA